MPRQADEEWCVVSIVGRPELLADGQEVAEILAHSVVLGERRRMATGCKNGRMTRGRLAGQRAESER
eukprot:2118242-Prymnesium_polylepis.2